MNDRLVRIVWFITLCYLVTAALWKPLFLVGSVPGPYWLFIAFDQSGLIAPLVGTLVFVVSSLALIWRGNTLKPAARALRYALSAICIIAALAAGCWISLYSLAQQGNHVQTMTLPSRTYQLAAYPMFDLNYRLYECDAASILCARIYHSGDLMNGKARLTLDDSRNGILVMFEDYSGERVLYVSR